MKMNTNNTPPVGSRAPRLGRVALAVALALASTGAARAAEIESANPDLDMRWDNTVRYNLAQRVNKQDQAILKSANIDDGDRNFNRGLVSNRLDLLSEFDFVYRKTMGFRVSGTAWGDAAYGSTDNANLASSNHLEGGVKALGLSPETRRWHKGVSGELLDAFAFAKIDVADMPLNLKLGRHTTYWGESILSPVHGVSYGQSPIDLRKSLSVPGTEVKELFVPRSQLSAQMQATPTLSLAAQYFLKWAPVRYPEAGSFLGFNDALLGGGEAVYLPNGFLAKRGPDVTPKNRGDYGVAARWSPEVLDATVGLYARRTADIQPQVVVKSAGLNTAYSLAYGSDIDIFGVSLSKSIGPLSFGGELSYRRNMPLASDVVIAAALPAQGETGAARGNTLHGVFNLLGTVSKTALFDAANWTGELTWNRVGHVSQGAAVYKGRDGYTGIDKVSKDFFGLGANFTPVWYQVKPGVDLYLPTSVSVGLSGNSAVTAGGNKHAGSFSIGVGADWKTKYRFDIKYVDFFGPYRTNAAGAIASNSGINAVLRDRGFIAATFKTTF